MRTTIAIGFLTAAALAQANFELQSPPCTYSFPVSCGATSDPEGVSKSAPTGFGNSIATVDTVNLAGMPCSGSKYARIVATGPLPVPIGGPMPSGLNIGSRVYIPVPAGAASVSFCWDFYLVDNPPQAQYNDGMSIDLITGCNGTVLSNLAYADAFTPSSGVPADLGSPCASTGWELLPPGPQSVMGAPVPPGATLIRVTVWNGGDDFASSHGVIDNVTFAAGQAPCALAFSSPFGPGSVKMDHSPCPASVGRVYFTPVDLTAGAFPAGWFYGLDITLPELLTLFSVGPPFTGSFDAVGGATTGPLGPAPGFSGLNLFAVATEWTPGYGAPLGARTAVSYTIP
jgi:hypothetical protein